MEEKKDTIKTLGKKESPYIIKKIFDSYRKYSPTKQTANARNMKFFLSNSYKKDAYVYSLIPKNEFFGVLCGTKEVGAKDISKISLLGEAKKEENTKKLIQLFDNHGVVHKTIKKPSFIFGKENNEILVYGKKESSVDKASLSLDTYKEISNYLGYPDCCIHSRGKIDDFKTIYEKSQNFSYLLNDISVYESIPETFLAKERNFEFTKNFKYFSGAFLTWNPCSYDCKKSIQKLTILEKFIKKIDPYYYNFIYQRAKKNILYFDKSNWISFDENIENEISKIHIFEGVFSNQDIYSFFLQAKLFQVKDGYLSLFGEDNKVFKTFEKNKEVYYLSFK